MYTIGLSILIIFIISILIRYFFYKSFDTTIIYYIITISMAFGSLIGVFIGVEIAQNKYVLTETKKITKISPELENYLLIEDIKGTKAKRYKYRGKDGLIKNIIDYNNNYYMFDYNTVEIRYNTGINYPIYKKYINSPTSKWGVSNGKIKYVFILPGK